MSLSEYVLAKEEVCKRYHSDCSKCIGDINAAKIVLEENIVPLPVLWRRSFKASLYDSGKAQRRLLQLPVIAVEFHSKVYIAAKSEKTIDEIKEEIQLKFSQDGISTVTQARMSSEDLNSILSVANSEADKSHLKHAVCSAYNLSKREAKNLYGISRLQERAEKVCEAANNISEIKSKHNFFARIEQKSFLLSSGLNVDDYLSELSSGSDSDVSEVELSSDDD